MRSGWITCPQPLALPPVNHVILNLKYGTRSAGEVLEELGHAVLPGFPAPSHTREATA